MAEAAPVAAVYVTAADTPDRGAEFALTVWLEHHSGDDIVESYEPVIRLLVVRVMACLQHESPDQDLEALRALQSAALGLVPDARSVSVILRACDVLRLALTAAFESKAQSAIDAIIFIAMSVAAEDFVSQVEQRGEVDHLTGLRGRRAFEREYAQGVSDASAAGELLTLVLADLDDLKLLNDQGYGVGNDALQRLARLLADGTKAGDTAYRWGGDEFPVILKRTTSDQAVGALSRIADAEGAPAFSFGIATFPDDADDASELWLAAERRLKEHKYARKAGRDAKGPAVDGGGDEVSV